MKRRMIVMGVVLVAGLSGTLLYHSYSARSRGDKDRVRISGNIEVVETQVSFKIPGRVEQRPVDEGDLVAKGAVVAVLDQSDLECDVAQRTAEWKMAEAALAALVAGSRPEEIAASQAAMGKAVANLAELEAGSRPQEIRVAEAALASTTADKIRLEAEFHRAEKLFERKAISLEEFDQASAAYTVAVAKMHDAAERLDLAKEGPRKEVIQAARAALEQARAQYALVKAGPRMEDIDQGRARVKQAEAAMELAKVKLGYATVRAPMPGVVLSKNIEPGEYVSPGTPIVTIGNLKDIWLRGYINNDTELGPVKVGQTAYVTTDSWPGKVFEGRVSFISQEAEFTPKTVQTQQERVKLVYRIKVDIQNPDMDLKPGMPADAEICVGSP